MQVLVAEAVLIFSVLIFTEAEFDKQFQEKQILDTIFASDKYDPSIRPSGENGSASAPVIVLINTFVRSISDIDNIKMEYNVQLTFRQKWTDDRLKYDGGKFKFLTLTRINKIWRPDVFFHNERSGHFHDILVPNHLIRIHPDGSVLSSTRISLKLACPIDLRNYPMDNQICSIGLASYGYTTDDIIFLWKEGDPVQITQNLDLPAFKLTSYVVDYCTSRTNTGQYSCIKLDLYFSRERAYHFVQSYISTTALVLVSWIAFWLDRRDIVARIAIWISALIAIVLRATTINSDIPEVSYIKAVDVWIGMCMTFIFCVIIQLCIVNNVLVEEDHRRLMNQMVMDDSKTDKHTLCIDDNSKPSQLRIYTFPLMRWLNKIPSKAQRIDAISRFLFPVAFAFFNMVYWLTYLPQRPVICGEESSFENETNYPANIVNAYMPSRICFNAM